MRVQSNVWLNPKQIGHWYTSRPTWGIESLRQTTDFYPRIPRWHDAVANTIV
jgi:hypothetical protein